MPPVDRVDSLAAEEADALLDLILAEQADPARGRRTSEPSGTV